MVSDITRNLDLSPLICSVQDVKTVTSALGMLYLSGIIVYI